MNSTLARLRWRWFVILVCLSGCGSGGPAPWPLALAEWNTHYLPDLEHFVDEQTKIGIMSHLVVFNPGDQAAEIRATAYFEDREPVEFGISAGPRQSTETNSSKWPLPSGSRFALRLRSDVPVVCQATLGWTNTANQYQPTATTASSRGIREAAASYLAVRQLATQWHIADGIVLDDKEKLWIRESEWLVVVNPTDQEVDLNLGLYEAKGIREHSWKVAPRRVNRLHIDPLVTLNRHHGVTLTSSVPVVANWRRHIYWYESSELMTFWTIPAAAAETPSLRQHEAGPKLGDQPPANDP